MLVVNRGDLNGEAICRWTTTAGMDQKQRRPAKQIPPYGAEGYILVSTNWLLWLTFRRTNMDPYRSVSNCRSTSKTLTLMCITAKWHFKCNPWTLAHCGEKGNRKYLWNCYSKAKAWLRESQFLGSDSRWRHVPGMLLPPVCPLCKVTHGWNPALLQLYRRPLLILGEESYKREARRGKSWDCYVHSFFESLVPRLLCIVF